LRILQHATEPTIEHSIKHWRRALFGCLVGFVVAVMAGVGGACFWAGICVPRQGNGNASDNVKDPPRTALPQYPSPTYAEEIVKYVNEITLSNRTIVPPTNVTGNVDISLDTPPEERALHWLLQYDMLQLPPNSPANRFRIQQRYGLATMWLQQEALAPLFGNPSNECSWFGVECEAQNLGDEIGVQQAVIKIALNRTNVNGVISSDFGLLSTLQHVDLSSYDITESGLFGSFPSQLGLWTKLRHLNIGVNALTGSLPASIGEWTNLEYFSAHVNAFVGSLPESLRKWSKLKYFMMDYNTLNGTLPTFISSWSNLEYFSIFANSFSGTLSESLGQWTSVQHVMLEKNKLRGLLPKAIGNWTNLTYFDIEENAFSGTLPPSIGRWSNLEWFSVAMNALKGTLPEEIGNWTNLQVFSVRSNNMTGSLPKSIGRWSNMKWFSVRDDNRFTGNIPTSILDWKQIQTAAFAFNRFTGVLPLCIRNVSSLIYLDADCGEVSCSCCTKCF
jgi:Leucine-rich repeat (LRR) protein